jgi:hypothetical protein
MGQAHRDGRCLNDRLTIRQRAEIAQRLLPILRRLVVDEFASELSEPIPA